MAMIEIVGRLPVVKDLITVLDGRECGSNDVGSEEDVECCGGLEMGCAVS